MILFIAGLVVGLIIGAGVMLYLANSAKVYPG